TVAAIGVLHFAGAAVVDGEEERGIAVSGRAFVKELLDGFQEARKIIERNRVTAAEVGLQVGHQKSIGNALPGNVGKDKREMPGCGSEGLRCSSIQPVRGAEIEEVVVIAANLARLNA